MTRAFIHWAISLASELLETLNSANRSFFEVSQFISIWLCVSGSPARAQPKAANGKAASSSSSDSSSDDSEEEEKAAAPPRSGLWLLGEVKELQGVSPIGVTCGFRFVCFYLFIFACFSRRFFCSPDYLGCYVGQACLRLHPPPPLECWDQSRALLLQLDWIIWKVIFL